MNETSVVQRIAEHILVWKEEMTDDRNADEER